MEISTIHKELIIVSFICTKMLLRYFLKFLVNVCISCLSVLHFIACWCEWWHVILFHYCVIVLMIQLL